MSSIDSAGVAGAMQMLPGLARQPRLEAPPFEGQLQRDAFVRMKVDGDAALRSFIERARVISTIRGDGLRVPQLPVDPALASPLST